MIDNDDIRYSKAEDRPPWELSPEGRFREWFSCRKVDDTTAGYCHEVEEQKKDRIRAQSSRSASHARLQRQREEAQRRLAQEQAAAARRMAEARARAKQAGAPQQEASEPAQPKDPRASRYSYGNVRPGQPKTNPSRTINRVNRKPQTGSKRAAVIVVVISLLISLISGLATVFEERFDRSGAEEMPPQIPQVIIPDEDEEEGGSHGFAVPWGDEDPWDSIIPDQGEKTPTTQSRLPRAETEEELTLDIHSNNGRKALTYQELYQRCLPSVVSIKVMTEKGGGTGTGIVVTEDGYILTCNHVIAGGETCTVTTYDDETYEAQLVGGDAQTDLAVLKIDAEGLTPAEFGDSDQLTVGDEVLTIGDPLGTELRGTLTNGIVSAINRNVTVNSYGMTLIQTTAALNAGNSGGPLLNIYGQVVGVNNMKMISSAVTVEGLGFAVPTTVIRDIVPILSAEGKVSRPVLGITVYGITEELAEMDDLPSTGLWVATINPASNGEEAGLKVGDFIYAVNGEHMESVDDVRPVLQEVGIGGDVTLTVYRFDKDDPEQKEALEIVITVMDQTDLK